MARPDWAQGRSPSDLANPRLQPHLTPCNSPPATPPNPRGRLSHNRKPSSKTPGASASLSRPPAARQRAPPLRTPRNRTITIPMSQPGASPTPPLLLTKRLNAFLHANQTSHLPTLLLTTAHGKLLAHASPHPVALLRTHATVAASLLAIHTSSSVDLPSALPGSRTPVPIASSPVLAGTDDEDDDSEDREDSELQSVRDEDEPEYRAQARRRSAAKLVKPVSITVQLSGGTVIIRRLKCGLLFVAVGPSGHEYQSDRHTRHENGDPTGSPSEVESLVSAGGQTTSSLESVGSSSVVAMRRHAGELARWLDDKLGTLRVPEEDGSYLSE
ncbi:hypothetical protein TOPH_07208 [Tolypocladium ophioglossoides CBS 100239]|uniref:Uncharacterized protein n=1 Tax=Tolypocladium ophioglossoides (strain CBS 100239) TaxID=1163406 RepID=A0A0L0N244_TOLOC|nr:hypothetical protein TOPH_07208 [Tolypocladium ophioglossoides CBS 100239]